MKESIKMNDYLMELFKFTIGKGNKDLIYPLVKEGIVSEKSVVKTINDADIESEEKSKYALELAKELKDVPIKGLEDIVVNANDVKDIYEFTKEVPKANKKKLTKAFMNSVYFEEESLLCNFALLPKVDLDVINDTLLKKCLDKDIPVSVVTNYVNSLQYHKNLPIDKFTLAVIKRGRPWDIVDFARNTENVQVDELADALIQMECREKKYWLYEFMLKVKNAPISKLNEAFKKESKKSMLKVQYSEKFLKILRLVRNKDIEGLRKYKDLLNEDKLTKKLK